MKLNVLITAGGTSEPIDAVRIITNLATGRLGSLIADEFVNKTAADVTFVCGDNSAIPQSEGVEIIKIGSTDDLVNTLTELLTNRKFDAVVHTMAVSDYKVKSMMTASECIEKTGSQKISSDLDDLILIMEKTPKAISLIKKLQPKTILFGFKLLLDVSEEELSQAGHRLLQKNNCDYVLANDLKNIVGEKHEGLLVAPECSYIKLHTKQEIAAAIVSATILKVRKINERSIVGRYGKHSRIQSRRYC